MEKGDLKTKTRTAAERGHKKVLQLSSVLPFGIGTAGSLVLTGLYLGIITLAQGWAQTLTVVNQDKFLVTPIVLGFGTQLGLYTHLRLLIRRAVKGSGAMTGASGGTSTAAMVACCAHRIADVLPIVGMTAAANFLAAYKTPFLAVGLTVTVIGIGIMLRMIVKQKAMVRRVEAQ